MWSSLWPKRLKSSLLQRCKDGLTLAKTHALLITTGLFSQGSSTTQLIASYANLGDIKAARQVFDKLPQRGTDIWNAMLVAYSRVGLPFEVVGLYRKMVSEGVRPDSSSFSVAIKACTSLSDFQMGAEIWHLAVDYGYKYDVFVGSSVLNMLAKGGKMEEAKTVFDGLGRKDLVCWTVMITGFAKSGQGMEAVGIYGQMREEGFEGDGVVMLGLIQACTDLGHVKMGLSIHGHMIRRNLPMDVFACTSLVDMYAKNGQLDLAHRVFSSMPQKNVVSWSALISGYAQNGFAGEALDLLIEMQTHGYKLDLASLVGAILACSHVGYLRKGKSIHAYILHRQEFECVSATAMIDMYSKCGALLSARVLFDQVSSKDVILWNAMIAGYGIHGHGKAALSVFLDMIKASSKPDDATFASLLSALGHSGLVEEGQYWYNEMINRFNIIPREKHYACIVDLLARAGRVEEAFKLVKSMKEPEPGISTWVALLSGCHNHRKFSIGEVAAKKVLQLEPDDSGIYSLAANFFAAAQKWGEVAKVRKTMRKMGTKKVPGYSMVEVKGKLHAFLMEDKSHYQHEQMVLLIDKLDHEMRAMGYRPKTQFVFHDVEEEVKVRMLTNHSERLAIDYGLLNTEPGSFCCWKKPNVQEMISQAEGSPQDMDSEMLQKCKTAFGAAAGHRVALDLPMCIILDVHNTHRERAKTITPRLSFMP
ncbi:hypothetical protein Cgig2_012063 [Carnegiea gigantea]|uniref:DYW domain-containing protein n=1 Tax=Carnegiea gigantea TaxID=171969 RepID=A0A9Q1QMA8_9CARY|nr:hypothetical protein Cgig2_012063 [Carnegiea gigantea]